MIVKSKELFLEVLGQISAYDKGEARAIVEHLFFSKFGLSRVDIMANRLINLSGTDLTETINRINRHEPIQYITETAWFANRKFFVNASVLIPRPETEIIVNHVAAAHRVTASVLDVGTGSGCIAIAIKLNSPGFDVAAIDVSDVALAVAKRNAALLGAEVSFHRLDLLKGELHSLGTFDFLVSNPPYVPDSDRDSIEKPVLDYEPHLALFVPNEDPLLFYRALAYQGKFVLNPGGEVVAEMNPLHAEPTAAVFASLGYEIEIKKDLEERKRILVARLTK